MLTTRDLKIIEFLEDFKIARTSTIAELFCKDDAEKSALRVAQRRLSEIYDYQEIKRVRDNITSEYLYYIHKPKQLKHRLMLTDFYREFSKLVKILDFKNEVAIENLRSDGLVVYKYQNKTYVAFVEVQIANKPLDIKKYLMLLRAGKYEKYFPVFPKLIAITNKKIEKNELDIIQIRENFSNLGEVFNEKNNVNYVCNITNQRVF